MRESYVEAVELTPAQSSSSIANIVKVQAILVKQYRSVCFLIPSS